MVGARHAQWNWNNLDNFWAQGQFFPNAAHASHYRCFSVSFAGREAMEHGNKILLPQSALHELASRHISWPMMFEIKNPKNNKSTHGGVLEFISDEGTCNIPYWVGGADSQVMRNLDVNEGDRVTITNVSLPKATWVKLKPLNEDYWDISNPRAMNYATLTVGDVIPIHYLQTVYMIEIVVGPPAPQDLKPARACSIIETDMEVEFDMVVPEPREEAREPEADPEASVGKRLDGKAPKVPKHAAEPVNRTPWKNKLPFGIRTHDPEYELMVENTRNRFGGRSK